MFNWKEAFNKSGFECMVNNIDSNVTPDFAKKLRNKLNVSQRLFSKILGVSEKTIEKWEQGANPIKGTASRLLYLLDKYDFLMNELYKVNKNDEQYQNQTKYVINIVPSKNKVKKNKDIAFFKNPNFYKYKDMEQKNWIKV